MSEREFSTKWILIAGSKRDDSDEEKNTFAAACRSLGARLAKAGFAIIGGSLRDTTADAHAFRGALSVSGSQMLVLRPESDTSEGPDNEDLRNVPLNTLPGTLNEIRPKLVEKADAVVLISGTSKGTRELFNLARADTRSIPLVIIPAFGGFAGKVYSEYRGKYVSDGISEDAIKHLEKWDEESPTIVETLLRRFLNLPDPVADEGGSASNKAAVVTFLLTWDPQRFPFANFAEKAREAAEKGAADMNWNVGHADVPRGSRVFLMRHGSVSPGLVGAGEIVGDVHEAAHWDKTKPSDWKTFYAEVRWSFLGELPLVPLDALNQQTSETELWTREGSGFPVATDVAARLENIWRDALAARQPSIDLPRAWLESDAIPVIGRTRYKPSEYDSLDVNIQAGIFATLMVAKDVEPPFALGLLGDWGVGKTFFMRLIQEKIESIAGKDAKAEGISASVSRAAQIEFNAWHYVDADLWASLASHIFDGLSRELKGPKDAVEDIRLRLRLEIRSSQQEQKEAKAAIVVAQEERQTAAKELEKKQAERAPAAASCEAFRLKRVWDAVLSVVPTPANPDWPNIPELKTKAEETARQLGITDAIDSAVEAQKVYQSMRDIARRGGGLVTAFAARFTGKTNVLVSTSVIAGLLAIVIALPWILSKIEAVLSFVQVDFSNLLAPVVQLATFAVPAAIWMSSNLKSISSALSYLEKIRDEIRNPRAPLSEPGQKEKDLKKQIEKLDAEIATERRKIEEADRQISQAQAEIQRINAGGLVYDFLNERVRDSRYLDKLGLISVIRRDFEELGTLLGDWRKHGAKSDAKTVPAANVSWDARPIERIILYIDDLDRCPPQRVVDVLQAVHLILAFDLFVVVVAVDARWLQRSLNEAYNSRAPFQVNSSTSEPMHRFSAHNYLEKIFQIPFALPPMDEKGFRRLVGNMMVRLRKKMDRAEVRAEPETLSKEESHDSIDSEAQTFAGDGEQSDAEVAGQSTQTEKERQDVGSAQQLQELQDKAKVERQQQEQRETKKRLEAMELRPWEEQFIAALFPFVSTPRLAKRLLNIYRLLRVRAASHENEEFANFIDRETGEYRAVLLLLAINVGHADVTAEIFDVFDQSQLSFRQWLISKSAEYEDERTRLSTDRVSLKDKKPPSRRESRLMELRDAVISFDQNIETVIHALAELSAATFDDRLEKYEKWASEVGRYSFRWQ